MDQKTGMENTSFFEQQVKNGKIKTFEFIFDVVETNILISPTVSGEIDRQRVGKAFRNAF